MSLVMMAAMIAVFVLVFLFTLEALTSAALFGRASSLVVACCVAVLSTAGLFGGFGGTPVATPSAAPDQESAGWLDVLLLPYAALALALIVVFCWWCLSRAVNWGASGKLGRDLRETKQWRDEQAGPGEAMCDYDPDDRSLR